MLVFTLLLFISMEIFLLFKIFAILMNKTLNVMLAHSSYLAIIPGTC